MAAKQKTGGARTLQDFKATYDRETRVRLRLAAALEALLKQGAEEWRSEKELCTLSGVSTNDIPDFREEFSKHIVYVDAGRADKRPIWFADPKVASRVR
jgi:hypothetical protein